MELLLIRHARPARVEDHDGPADPPLTELGHRQAEALAAWLAEEGVDAVCTSPLRRAAQTAAPLAAKLGLEPATDGCLSEFDAEARSYVPIEELQAVGDTRWMQLPDDVPAFQQAVVEGIEGLIRGHQTGKLALVCHGGVINVYTAWVGKMADPLYFLPGYTSISRVFASSAGHRTLGSLNETAHLRVAGVPATAV